MNTQDRANLLRDRIANREATVGVIGLGYVGLPLVELFAKAGFKILGFDIDPEKIRKLSAGESYIGHIDSSRIKTMNAEGLFQATTDFSRLSETDAMLICVPTPLGEYREPDLGPVIKTGQAIGRHLRPGQLVILESTTYPGTTRDVLRPELEINGLKAGEDYFLAYSPEREDPGNNDHSAGKIPKVVGGYDPNSAEIAQMLYGAVVPKVVPVQSCEVAEACKILENTYRAVNIAMVNELKMLFTTMGINIWDVIDAAKTKPFGFQAFTPGPGLGGHCIPIDPFYLTWIARRFGQNTKFIELAGEINTNMPQYVVGRVAEALNHLGKPIKGSKILILGAAYKKDVDDPRESPAFELMEKLLHLGASVAYNDPHIPEVPSMRRNSPRLKSLPLNEANLADQDCALICTDHTAYDWDFIVQHSTLVVDTRNATRKVVNHRDRIVLA